MNINNLMPKSSAEAVRIIQEAVFTPFDEIDKSIFGGVENANATIAYYHDTLVIIKDRDDYVFITQSDDSPDPIERRLKLEGG